MSTSPGQHVRVTHTARMLPATLPARRSERLCGRFILLVLLKSVRTEADETRCARLARLPKLALTGAGRQESAISVAGLELSPEEQAALLSASGQPDVLPSVDDELDAHPCMLPLVSGLVWGVTCCSLGGRRAGRAPLHAAPGEWTGLGGHVLLPRWTTSWTRTPACCPW